MNKLYLRWMAVLAVLFSNEIAAQTVTKAWNTSYGTSAYDQFTGVVNDGSGNVYMVGTEGATGSAAKLVLIKYNSAGATQWLVRYAGGNYPTCMARAITIDGSGNVYVAGVVGDVYGRDLVVMKYNTAGQQQWLTTFQQPGDYLESPEALRVDASGNVYIGGTINTSLSDYDLMLLKFSPTGVLQWMRTANGSSNKSDFFGAMTTDGSGNIYMTGQVHNTLGRVSSYDYRTYKYSTAGVLQWSATYNNTKTSYDSPTGIGVDASGNVFVTGRSNGLSNYDYATVKYNSAGASQWVQRYNGVGNLDDYATGLVVDGGGNVIVTGTASTSSTLKKAVTLKYNTTGVQQWASTYFWDAYTTPNKIAIDRSGFLYISGGSGTDAFTVKYGSNGVQAWAQTFSHASNSSENSLGLAIYNPGSIITNTPAVIYIGGSVTFAPNNTDLFLVKYTQQNTGGTIGSKSIIEPLPVSLRFGVNVLPNPMKETSRIRYSLAHDSEVSLKIYDVAGREVRNLVNGQRAAGEYQVDFHRNNLKGSVYYYTLNAISPKGNYLETKSILISD